MKIRYFLYVALCCLPACQSSGPIRIQVPFDETKARSQLKPGSNQISGRVMVGLSSGTIVTCANSVVSLSPTLAGLDLRIHGLRELPIRFP